MKFLMGIILAVILLTGCGNSTGNGEARINSAEADDTSVSSEKIKGNPSLENKNTAASAPDSKPSNLTPPQSMKLKEERDGIIPVSIEIPSLNVNTSIEKVGRLANGEMGVPKGFDTVGWFEPGVQPGAPGNSVMAGHVDSKAGPAVFYKLDELQNGDEVIVRDKDGKTMIFEVTGKESYDRKNAPVDKIFDFAYTSKLNLITCTGTFNQDERTHEERLVVYTELKESQN
jgi:sortase (surface protein transpeptidase)